MKFGQYLKLKENLDFMVYFNLFNKYKKIAIFVTDSDFDETSFIGSVKVNYNNVSRFVVIGLVV